MQVLFSLFSALFILSWFSEQIIRYTIQPSYTHVQLHIPRISCLNSFLNYPQIEYFFELKERHSQGMRRKRRWFSIGSRFLCESSFFFLGIYIFPLFFIFIFGGVVWIKSWAKQHARYCTEIKGVVIAKSTEAKTLSFETPTLAREYT